MTFLPNELLLTLPAGPVFDAHIRTIPNERLATGLENEDGTAEVIGRMTRTELERRARKATVETAILLAENATDTGFLAWMSMRDQRKSVRVTLALNSRTPVSLLVDLLDEQLAAGRKDAALSLLKGLDPMRILQAGRSSETVHAFIVRTARRNLTFTSRLTAFLTTRPVACWPLWLGTPRNRDELLPAILASNSITPEIAYQLASGRPFEANTPVNEECRKALAGVLASGDTHTPEELLHRFPWPELASQLVNSFHGATIPFSLLKRTVTPEQLDVLAVRLLSYEATLDAGMCEWMLAQPRYPTLAHSGRHTIDESMMIVLEDALEDFAGEARNPDTGLAVPPTGLLFAVNTVACHGTAVQLGRIIATLPEMIADWLTAASKQTAGRFTPSELALGVAAANAYGTTGGGLLLHLWLVRRNEEDVTEPIADLIVETLAAGHRIPAINSRRNYGQVITRRDQIERLAGSINGSKVDQTKFDMAVDARWWRSDEARSAFPRLLELLAFGEVPHPEPMSGYWEYSVASRFPAAFSELTAGEALTLAEHAPRAAAHIRATAFVSRVELSEAQRALIPGSTIPSSSIDATYVWAAIGEYLNERLENDPASWNIALALLPDWQGTIEELANASCTLA